MPDPDGDLREELQYHLDRRAEANRAQGMSPAEADRLARRQTGNPTWFQEEMRAMRIPAWLESVARDLAYATRSFARTPAFTVAAVAALALGIGSTTAVFSVVDRLLFRPLPYLDESRLVSLGMAHLQQC